MKYDTVPLKSVLQPKGYIRGPFGSALKRRDMLETGIPVYEQQHAIYSSRTFRFFISPAKATEMNRFAVEENDLIISCSGTVGMVSLIQKNDPKGIISQALLLLRANPKIIDPVFLNYFFKSQEGYNSIISRSSGSVQVNISKREVIESIPIPLPPIDVQKKTAAILSALDEKIAINRAINDNLQQQAASIFAEWLNTCTDFSTIGDMAHNILDYSPVASEQIRLLNSSDVAEGVFPVVPLVPNKNLKGHFKKRFQFGDILYSEIRPRNHHYGLVLFDASDYIASTRLMVIRAIEKKVSPVMLYQYLLLPEVEAEFTLKTESRSGTFPQGNYADMASIQVPYSPTNSQTAVSEILSRIRFAIAQNQFESQRLAELRDTLLPKLMSGEIDVFDVQI